MKIPGKEIVNILENELKREFNRVKKHYKPRLVVFLVEESPEQQSFVKIKQRLATKLGVQFHFIFLKKSPSFEELIHLIKNESMDEKNTGIIIQQPLPMHLQTDSIYDFINVVKEIEGHKRKTTYYPPIGLAVLTIFKYIFTNQKASKDLLVDMKKDLSFFKRIFKNKRVVLVGKGMTGGKPIGLTLTQAKINYINVNSETPNPQEYFQTADIIITATGKKILKPEMLKPGVILVNVGMHHEKGVLKGDYEEREIKDIASFYTSTPGGIGPIDVLYLFKNLLDAAKTLIKK